MTARVEFVEEASELAIEWPFLQSQLLLAPELWNTYNDIAGIYRRLTERSLQLWVLKNNEERLAWAISEVWTRNDGRQVLVIWWAQGSDVRKHLPILIQTLRRVVKAKGFAAVTVRGRRGWERLLAPHGFTFLRVELIHEIGDET